MKTIKTSQTTSDFKDNHNQYVERSIFIHDAVID